MHRSTRKLSPGGVGPLHCCLLHPLGRVWWEFLFFSWERKRELGFGNMSVFCSQTTQLARNGGNLTPMCLIPRFQVPKDHSYIVPEAKVFLHPCMQRIIPERVNCPPTSVQEGGVGVPACEKLVFYLCRQENRTTCRSLFPPREPELPISLF